MQFFGIISTMRFCTERKKSWLFHRNGWSEWNKMASAMALWAESGVKKPQLTIDPIGLLDSTSFLAVCLLLRAIPECGRNCWYLMVDFGLFKCLLRFLQFAYFSWIYVSFWGRDDDFITPFNHFIRFRLLAFYPSRLSPLFFNKSLYLA